MEPPHLDPEALIRQAYPQLRAMAGRLLRHERPDHTLQATALANEAILKLFGKHADPDIDARTFLGFAAHQMRQILIDHGRKHASKKRGGDFTKVPLLDDGRRTAVDLDSLLTIDAALDKLGRIDARALQVVELRFFGGFTIAETAGILSVCDATVESIWLHARLWLFRELGGVPAKAALAASGKNG